MKLLSSVTVPLVLLGSAVAPGSCGPPPDSPASDSPRGGATPRPEVGGGKTDGDSIDPAQIEAIKKRLATNERRRVAFAKGQPLRGIDDLEEERDRVRAKAIREQIADQPPLRTVTGSFRVHTPCRSSPRSYALYEERVLVAGQG